MLKTVIQHEIYKPKKSAPLKIKKRIYFEYKNKKEEKIS